MDALNEELRDVVIYEIATGRIDAVIGRRLKPTGRYNSVESRIEAALPRLNENYTAADVLCDAFYVGDILPRSAR